MLLSNAAHGCAPGRRRSKRIATRALRSAPPNPVEPPLEQPVEGEGSTVATEISALPIAPVPVPDTEIGYLPGVAAVETLKVSVELLAVSTGLQDAVAPGGNPSARRWTDPLNPLWGEIVIENDALPPRGMVADGGPAVRSNPGPVTVSSTEAVWVRPPPAAITEKVQRPVGVSFPRETVSTSTSAVAPGANEAVAPGAARSPRASPGSFPPRRHSPGRSPALRARPADFPASQPPGSPRAARSGGRRCKCGSRLRFDR